MLKELFKIVYFCFQKFSGGGPPSARACTSASISKSRRQNPGSVPDEGSKHFTGRAINADVIIEGVKAPVSRLCRVYAKQDSLGTPLQQD